jgi:hypothetical protein
VAARTACGRAEAGFMRIEIFTFYHFIPETYVANDLYKPMVLGHRVGKHPALLSDEDGDNISGEESHCEMRGQYYVWKNLLSRCDYVGFQHYRRWMFFDHMQKASQHPLFQLIRRNYLSDPHLNDLAADEDVFKIYMDAVRAMGEGDLDVLRETISHYDIVTVRPWKFNLGEQYRSLHVPEDWDKLMQVIAGNSRFRSKPNFLHPDIQAFYSCSMFVMRASEFHDYMTFWRETMQAFAVLVKPHADKYQSRIYGFLAERVFSLYLYQLRMERPDLRVLEVPKIVGPQKAV